MLLPDSKSSVRWETVDRPFLKEAFDAAGVPVEIQNAEGDKSTQQQQAEQAITNGAKVLLLVNLDSGSGAAIAANAKSRGVKVIDYDRLTLNGDSDYYVSFDNEKVGKLQGEGLVKCLRGRRAKPAVAVLNGSPTDNNATLFKKGYDSVIDPKFKAGEWTEVADQSVPDWDNQKALTIFEQMLQKANNKIDGVLAANDGLGNAAISALKQRKLDQIPVTGQDATLQGLQNIVAGDQCMTVYKAIKKEADAAAKLAIALAKGEEPDAGRHDDRTTAGRQVPVRPARRRSPVTKDNIKDYRHRDGLPQAGGDLRRQARRRLREAGPLGRVRPRGPGRRGSALRSALWRRENESADTPILELHGVSKSFGAVQALYEVDFPVCRRRGHGARRRQRRRQVDARSSASPASTRSTTGEILFDGEPVTIHGPKDAAALGIEVVYQDLALADNLDVVQNMFLGREETTSLRRLDETAMEARARRRRSRACRVTTIRSVRQTVAGLSGGQRQSVAVAKAVMWNSRVVILDEPTAALGVAQTRRCSTSSSGSGSRASRRDSSRTTCTTSSRWPTTSRSCASARTSREFKRKDTNQQQVVEAITAGRSTKVPAARREEAVAR